MRIEGRNEVDVPLDMDRDLGVSASYDPLDRWPRLATQSFSIAHRVPRVVFPPRRRPGVGKYV